MIIQLIKTLKSQRTSVDEMKKLTIIESIANPAVQEQNYISSTASLERKASYGSINNDLEGNGSAIE